MRQGLSRWLGRVAALLRSSPVTGTRWFADLESWRATRESLQAAEAQPRQAFTTGAIASAPVYCGLCAQRVTMVLPWVGTATAPDLREGLCCPLCGLNARSRAVLGLVVAALPDPDARIYLTEQASPVFVWLRRHYPQALGSEFMMTPSRKRDVEAWLHGQGVPEAIALEDVTALTHATASLDAIGSFDVLEHVPEYWRALSEFARVLKPGGDLWLTLPFIEDSATTLVRARIDEHGGIEHLLPPEIHGDPLSDGVLCYYHFGWDLLDAVRSAGFVDAAWGRTWIPVQAFFGVWTLHARRAPEASRH